MKPLDCLASRVGKTDTVLRRQFPSFFIFIELFPPDGRPADSEPNRILRNFNRFVFFFGGDLNFKEN